MFNCLTQCPWLCRYSFWLSVVFILTVGACVITYVVFYFKAKNRQIEALRHEHRTRKDQAERFLSEKILEREIRIEKKGRDGQTEAVYIVRRKK